MVTLKSSLGDSSFTQNSFRHLQPTPTNSSSSQVRSDPIQSTPAKHSSQFWSNPSKTNKTQVRSVPTKTFLTNQKPTIVPQLISIETCKPKPSKCYSYPWGRRGDPYPPVLILVANQWWLSRLGRWPIFLVQVYLCFLSFSLILLFFFSFFFINSKSPSDASAKIVIFELKKKKEEGSREWGLWFFRARTQDLKLDFHLKIEFLRHDLLKKSSLTNSRY